MIHDRVATVAALARNTLSCVDRSQIDTRVQTGTLVLLLESLIALSESPVGQRVEDGATRSLAQMVAEVETAAKARDDDRTNVAVEKGDEAMRERQRRSGLLARVGV